LWCEKKSGMKRLRKFLQLARTDQLLLLQTILVLGIVTLGLRILPLLTLQSRLLKLANRHTRFVPAQRSSAHRIAWAIRVASRYIPKSTCLPRALAAQFLLIQRMYPADLQIGITRNEDGRFEAHAWVTSGSRIILGGVHNLDHFVPLSPMKREGIEDYASAP